MRSYILAALVVLLWAIPASAGTDKWTGKFNATVGALGPGERATITPSGTGATDILEVSACASGVLATDDNTVTFHIEWCNTNAGACYQANSTVIDASVDSGMQMNPLPSFIRVNVVSNAGAAFTMSCK